MSLGDRWDIFFLIILAIVLFLIFSRCKLRCWSTGGLPGAPGPEYPSDSYKPIGCWNLRNFMKNAVQLNKIPWSYDKCLKEAGKAGYKYLGITTGKAGIYYRTMKFIKDQTGVEPTLEQVIDFINEHTDLDLDISREAGDELDCWVTNDLPPNKNPGKCRNIDIPFNDDLTFTGVLHRDLKTSGIAVYEAYPDKYIGQLLGCWNDSDPRTLDIKSPHTLFTLKESVVDSCMRDNTNYDLIYGYNKKYFSVQNYRIEDESQKYDCWYGDDIGTVGTLDDPGERGYKMYGLTECTKGITGEDVGANFVNAVYRGGQVD